MPVGQERLARRRRIALANIARRAWLLQMLALGAAGCRGSTRPADARRKTLIVALSDTFPRPLCPDYSGERLVSPARDQERKGQ